MIVGIVGLGLIGGSFAKAYAEAGHDVLGMEKDASVLEFARMSEAVSGELTEENVGRCDLVLLCVYPEAALKVMEELGPAIGKKPVVIDCCGTKRVIVEPGMKIARKYGFMYVGGHPMAGTQYSGFKYSRADLYNNAPMVIVPPTFDDIELLERVKELLAPAGFGKFSVTTALEHDRMIAFTSQLAHVVSNAYVKSPTAESHKGFSAGSYKDLTRVAWLNPEMWAELFLEDADFLTGEIAGLIERLGEYRKAIEEGDRSRLTALLEEGRRRKEEIDRR
ncbi:MAG: prephenate dehydrogenase [Thermoguttaceae bacterium]|nr:prephenate dehydrogenase [Thermoguttaceae bacterium]MBR6481232.1 prephenate dehydrogenase [Thermoguttaceae bacterium]